MAETDLPDTESQPQKKKGGGMMPVILAFVIVTLVGGGGGGVRIYSIVFIIKNNVV